MFKYRFLGVFSALIMLISSIGCGNKTDDAYIYFELPQTPATLDPQVASSDSELLIVRNIYEGLMRKDRNGEIVEGAIESYRIDGLTYTFILRENIFWSNEEKLTANDFVFGLKRALDPETKAPFASRLFAIKNAKSVNSGKLAAENLGVTAINSKTVRIELENEDKNFLEVLTTSVAMPCNEKFFKESAGKYGLFGDKIISNSSYRLTKWNKESFGIRLYKNEKYNGKHTAKNAAVFLTCNDNESVTEKLIENNIDIAFIDCALRNDMENKGFKTQSFQNICWVLTINNDFSPNMRTALLKLVGGDVYSKSLMSGYSIANSIFPEISNVNTDGIDITSYNISEGKALYSSEVKKLENSKFPSDITLKFYDNGYIKPIVTDIVGHWQSNLSAFVNIESVGNKTDLLPQLKNQTISMAIFPVRADSKNNTEYLSNFSVTNFEPVSAQKEILKSKNITPLFFEDTTLCYSPNIEKINVTEDNGYIDFAHIIKIEN